MTPLYLKKETDLQQGAIYSICLRGVRRFEVEKYTLHNLSIYVNGKIAPYYIAQIEKQQHFRFLDLQDEECSNNYNPECSTVNNLHSEMKNIYPDFSNREIVTLLTFRILNKY